MEDRRRVIQDRYEVGDRLGQGGATTVYRGRDLRLDRAVAIKLLRPEQHADTTFVTRFVREARSAAQLSHPFIVPIYDYGEVAGTCFIVMEYVTGGNLGARLHGGLPMPIADAVRLAAEVAEGVGAAHAVGVVHGDVKPGNILLTQDGHARITDFGIGKMIAVPTVTKVSASLGTSRYAAPEQTNGGETCPATDVYGLGVVLFEMLAGRPPYEGASPIEVAMQHLQAPPPALSLLNHGVPPELEAIVVRALAKKPRERFPDGTIFAAALRERAAALGHSKEPVLAVPVVTGPVTDLPRGDAPAVRGRPAARRGKRSEPRPDALATAPRSADDEYPDAANGATPPRVSVSEPSVDLHPHPFDSVGSSAPPPAQEVSRPADPPGRWIESHERSGVPARPAGFGLGRGGTESRSRAAAIVAGLIFLACGFAIIVANDGPGRWSAGNTAPPLGEAAAEPLARALDTSTAMPGIIIVEPTTAAAPPTEPVAPTTSTTALAADVAVAPDQASTSEPTADSSLLGRQVVIDDDAFEGGVSEPRNYRGRTARWIYGARGPYGVMTAEFNANGSPDTGELLLKGIDSQGGPPTPMEIRINDTVIYQGGNPLPKETWGGSTLRWGEATFPIPAGVLRSGGNTITISNLVPVNNFYSSPYVMVDEAVISY